MQLIGKMARHRPSHLIKAKMNANAEIMRNNSRKPYRGSLIEAGMSLACCCGIG